MQMIKKLLLFMFPSHYYKQSKLKEWKEKGLKIDDIIYFHPEKPNVVYTHNGCRVMMTLEELLKQERQEGLEDMFKNVE